MLRIALVLVMLSATAFADGKRLEVKVDATIEVEVGNLIGFACDHPKLIDAQMKTKKGSGHGPEIGARGEQGALANQGAFHFNDDLITLLEIQRSGARPHPLPAYFDGLREVARGIGPGEDRMRRAFACTLLCIDDAAGLTPGGHEGTLAMLLSTCLELGGDAVESAIGLFAALADAYEATHFITHLAVFADLALAMSAAWQRSAD